MKLEPYFNMVSWLVDTLSILYSAGRQPQHMTCLQIRCLIVLNIGNQASPLWETMMEMTMEELGHWSF